MSLTAAVSPLLAPLRRTSWSGSVLATGRFGAYLSVPGAAVDVVPLLGVDAIALPTAVRLGVPFPHEALPLAVGDPVRLDDDGVTVAGRRVPLVRAWTPARVRPVDRLRPFAPMAEGRAHLVAAAAAEPGSAVATLIGRGTGLLRGLAGLADTLINGMSREQARADTYAARIGADKRAPVLVLSRIVKDTKDARAGLSGVSREARALLDQPEVTDSQHVASRADLMSYERALVRAQMAYRSFQSALGEVAARPELDVDTGVVDQELDAFAATIDDARDTANQLADKYASVGTAAS